MKAPISPVFAGPAALSTESSRRVLQNRMTQSRHHEIASNIKPNNQISSESFMKPIGNPMIFHRYPLEEALRLMVKFGYRELELWPPQIEMFRTDALRGQLTRQAKSLGLSLLR